MRSTRTFSILFWQYAQRANVNNEAGLYARISLNGKKANISLKKKLDIKLWDSKKQRAKGTTLTLSNGVPIETVSKMPGHTKLATTQIYARTQKRKASGYSKKSITNT